jgi:heat shock protein HslJ
MVGTSAKFHDTSEHAQKLLDQLTSTAQTVLGLALLVAGALLLGKAGVLTVLLMFGGFLLVISGLLRFNTSIPESGIRFVILASLFALLQLQPNVARGADPTPIEGKTWQLSELRGFPSLDSDLRAAEVRLEPGSKITIHHGCYLVGGDYFSTSDSITVNISWSSRVLCFLGSEASDKFTTLFRGTVTWRIVGGKLQLLNKVGQVAAVFIEK